MNPGSRVVNLIVCIIIVALLLFVVYIPAMQRTVRFTTGKGSVIRQCVKEWHKALTWDTK